MFSGRHIASMRRTAQRLIAGGDGRRGAGAVEFALMLPFVLLLILAIIEMSNVYLVRNQLSDIVRDATRRFAVGALEKNDVEAFVLKRLAESTDVKAEVTVDESETDGVVDVSLSLSVPFSEILLFDQMIEKLWAEAPSHLTVDATMMKH